MTARLAAAGIGLTPERVALHASRGDYVVDTVSGRVLIWSEAVGNSFNDHHMAARLQTLEGWHWVKRLRQLRRPMPGEVRVALRCRAALAAATEGRDG